MSRRRRGRRALRLANVAMRRPVRASAATARTSRVHRAPRVAVIPAILIDRLEARSSGSYLATSVFTHPAHPESQPLHHKYEVG